MRRFSFAVPVLAFAVLTAAAPLAAQAPTSATLSAHQKLAREVYEELVEINSADSVGSVTKAAEAMAARFRAAGFPASDVQVLIPEGKPAKGNLVVRYRGRASSAGGRVQKPLLLLAHIDVVAANRADWVNDPFELREENGFFLGRGTADDKAMAAIFVANLLRYKQEGWVPDRDLVLALTADEENGDANGVEYLIAQHRDLIDAEYAINEGGGGVIENGKPVLHAIQAAEKVYTDFTFTATNAGGHSSVPRADNAIYELADALGRLAKFQFPVALNDITRSYFQRTSLVEPRAEMAAAMRALVANPADAAAAATLSKDARYASMLRTTCVATRLNGGHAYNALPQLATANVNCRIVPTSTAEETRATLARVVGDTGVHITLTIPANAGRERFGTAPAPIPADLMAATTMLTQRMWGDIPVIPTMSTGATDGRFLRAAGIPTYGVSGIFSAPGETFAHGRDEKLRVKSFYEGLTFLDQLVRQLSTSKATRS